MHNYITKEFQHLSEMALILMKELPVRNKELFQQKKCMAKSITVQSLYYPP
jgi:hypothetical protein